MICKNCGKPVIKGGYMWVHEEFKVVFCCNTNNSVFEKTYQGQAEPIHPTSAYLKALKVALSNLQNVI